MVLRRRSASVELAGLRRSKGVGAKEEPPRRFGQHSACDAGATEAASQYPTDYSTRALRIARWKLVAPLPTERAELTLSAPRAEHQNAGFLRPFVYDVGAPAYSELVAFKPTLNAPEKSSRSSHPGSVVPPMPYD
jgi:hypothetical protein